MAKHGIVAAKHPFISKTGIDVMRKGGNAVDAAVAAAFIDCVVEPAMNGIGGEGIMAIHMVDDGKNTIIDSSVGLQRIARPICMSSSMKLSQGGWDGDGSRMTLM